MLSASLNKTFPSFLLKNWRSLTLLNTSYKIASGCIANRIKQVLDKISNIDQTGFVKGRYLGDIEYFKFKSSIKNWIKTLYSKSLSRVLQNRFLSE